MRGLFVSAQSPGKNCLQLHTERRQDADHRDHFKSALQFTEKAFPRPFRPTVLGHGWEDEGREEEDPWQRVLRLSPKARGPGLCGTEKLSGLSGAVVRGQETKRSMEARLSLYSPAS